MAIPAYVTTESRGSTASLPAANEVTSCFNHEIRPCGTRATTCSVRDVIPTFCGVTGKSTIQMGSSGHFTCGTTTCATCAIADVR